MTSKERLLKIIAKLDALADPKQNDNANERANAKRRADFLREQYAQDDSPEVPDSVFDWVVEVIGDWRVVRGGEGDLHKMLAALNADLMTQGRPPAREGLIEELRQLAKKEDEKDGSKE